MSLKFPFVENSAGHNWHLWSFPPLCGFSPECVNKCLSKSLLLRTFCHTQYIHKAFLHCVSVDVSLNVLLLRIQQDTIGIYGVFPHYVVSLQTCGFECLFKESYRQMNFVTVTHSCVPLCIFFWTVSVGLLVSLGNDAV